MGVGWEWGIGEGLVGQGGWQEMVKGSLKWRLGLCTTTVGLQFDL